MESTDCLDVSVVLEFLLKVSLPQFHKRVANTGIDSLLSTPNVSLSSFSILIYPTYLHAVALFPDTICSCLNRGQRLSLLRHSLLSILSRRAKPPKTSPLLILYHQSHVHRLRKISTVFPCSDERNMNKRRFSVARS